MALPSSASTAPVWCYYALWLGLPVWCALGLGGFIWPLLAAPMAAWLVMQRRLRYPPGFGLWVLLLVLVLASGVAIGEPARLASYVFRAAMYASVTVLLLFVYNAPSARLPTRRAVQAMAFVWAVAVAGGFAGILFPGLEFRSVTEALLPQGVAGVPFIRSFVHPGFAETTALLGYPVPRPKAPFNYTNQWGANLALLTPFLLACLTATRRRGVRIALATGLTVSLVPVLVSLNRGLWLSLGVAIVYVAVRYGLRGDRRAVAGVVALLAVLVLVLAVSPLGDLVTDRFTVNANTESRTGLYQDAVSVVQKSPVIGFGAPVEAEGEPDGPSVGTHGQLWTVLVSQGILGLLVYLAWLATVLRATAGAPRDQLWLHAVVVVAIVQLPVYSALPAQLHIVAVAVALVLRDQHERQAELRRETVERTRAQVVASSLRAEPAPVGR